MKKKVLPRQKRYRQQTIRETEKLKSKHEKRRVWILFGDSLLEAKAMSKPVLDFGLGSLDFRNTLLGGNTQQSSQDEPASSKDLGTVASTPTILADDDVNQKTAKLPNGKQITIKKKSDKGKKNSADALDALKKEKENYGFNINELYAKLEVQRLKDKSGSSNKESYIPKNDVLWAEKWRPKSFFELIGNDDTNRRMLKWVKEWSRVVFDKNYKPITTDDSSATNSKFIDPFGRPNKKIMLIHGPPGLGKTTVAHVIAKQAGYEIMEVNASDERSGQRVRDKIVNSLASQTFSGKPVCLIADEVDGAAEFGFIKVLVDLINEDQKAIYKFQHSDSDRSSKEKSKKKPKFLLRPIIAICNDLYAPSLEKLRMHSEIIAFKAPSERDLRERLRDICKHEKISLTNQQLQEIVLLTNRDIRSCLNILQFGGGLNSSNDLRKKDSQVSWFAIVNEIFRRRRDLKKGVQFKELANIISINNNYDKIINGCFQSYHDITYNDSGMSKPAMISDWLYFGDIMGKTTYEAIGDLSYYSSQVALQFFNQFSDLGNRETIMIKSDYEHFESRRANFNLLRLLHSNVNVHLRTFLKLQQLPTDVLPLLDYIITPELKSLNNIKDYDKKKLHDAIDSLQGFGLRITEAKDEAFNEIYTTYPQFSSISKFDALSTKKLTQKRTQLFPVLQKEMDLVRVKKKAFSEVEKDAKAESSKTGADFALLKNQYEKIAEAELKAKKLKTEVKIWVKYHEGFSNAVRKPVKWKSLWE